MLVVERLGLNVLFRFLIAFLIIIHEIFSLLRIVADHSAVLRASKRVVLLGLFKFLLYKSYQWFGFGRRECVSVFSSKSFRDAFEREIVFLLTQRRIN